MAAYVVEVFSQGSQTRSAWANCGPQDNNFGLCLRIKMKMFQSIGMFLSEPFLQKT